MKITNINYQENKTVLQDYFMQTAVTAEAVTADLVIYSFFETNDTVIRRHHL